MVAQIPPEHIIWVDETGIEQQMHRPYAREIIGKRAISNISGKRVPRTTLIAGYVQGNLIAPMHFKGTTDTEMFNVWLENMLLPELQPHHVVIMDNAAFHRSQRTKELIQSKGATLLFQPKYSPDLNKIEPQWANLKHHIKSDQQHISWYQKLEKHILKMCNYKCN